MSWFAQRENVKKSPGSLPVTTRIPEFTRIPENRATTIFSGIRVGICTTSVMSGMEDGTACICSTDYCNGEDCSCNFASTLNGSDLVRMLLSLSTVGTVIMMDLTIYFRSL